LREAKLYSRMALDRQLALRCALARCRGGAALSSERQSAPVQSG